MKNIALFCEESSLFAAPFLAEALNCNLYVMLPQYNNFFQSGQQGKFWNNGKDIYADHLIVIGYTALYAISKLIGRFKTVAVILSDSSVCRNYIWLNDFTQKNKIVVYSMPDLMPYCTNNCIPAYQTMRLKYAQERGQHDRLIVGHSPNNGIKHVLKGSPFIVSTLESLRTKYDFEFRLIQNATMSQCIALKSECDIFIDQMIYRNPDVPQSRWGGKIRYEGGLGKSGIEAMMLGCCTITGGVEPQTQPYFPPPPVIWSSYDTFKRDMTAILKYGRESIARTGLLQQQWTQVYLNKDFVANHVTHHIR